MIRQHCQLMDMNLSKLRETVKDREAWRATVYGLQRVRHNLATEQQHIRAFPFSNSPFGVEQSRGHLFKFPSHFRSDTITSLSISE